MELESPDKGTLWVIIQMPLLAVTITVPVAQRLLNHAERWSVDWTWISRSVGVLALVGAVLLFMATKRALGAYLVAYPRPVDDAPLRTDGVYRYVRHPMYLAIIVGTTAWALVWTSIAGAILSIVCAMFFFFKSIHEEKLLVAHFPAYPRYQREVARLLPHWQRRNVM
ncbi:MAG: isoprenylcysteine carboxylmethyltransferase family protein [Chloroflexota bacterium]